MALSLQESWKTRIRRAISNRAPVCESVTLRQRNIFILPSRHGLMFLFAAGLIFIAAINYAVSLAFGLAFLMVSIFIIAVLHTFNNLHGLRITAMPTSPVFCGEDMGFKVLVNREQDKSHEAIQLQFVTGEGSERAKTSHVNLALRDQEEVHVFMTSSRRGLVKAPLLRVTTYFPLGIARAWSWVNLQMHCLVYPKPEPVLIEALSGGGSEGEESPKVIAGNQDFYGIREYVAGDSMRQIAWKAVARGQGLKVKQFVDYQDNRMWLDWDLFYGLGVEERLSRLCYCVLQLAKRGEPYGLKIPGQEFAPGTGQEHRNKLLKALALFGSE